MRIPVILLILLFTSCKMKEKVDLIVYDARIYTPESEKPAPTHMVVHDGKVVAIGNQREIMNNYDAESTFNAGGRPLYPGFIDSHCHFFGYAEQLGKVNLMGTSSWNDVVRITAEFAENHPGNTWITGRGWDHTDWEVKEFPNKKMLDSLFPDRPVLIKRVDGHAAIANSKALRLAGIDTIMEIQGGVIERKDGELTGILIDNAVDLVNEVVPPIDRKELVKLLKQAAKDCFNVGLTTVVDAGLDYEKAELIDSLQKTGDFPMRMHIMLNPKQKNFDWAIKTGGIEHKNLRVKGFKIYADGALGSQGALLKEDYSDMPGNKGLLLTPIDTIRQIIQFCYENNFQANTHCIGDSAVSLILNLYGEQLGGVNDRRWRIEHVQVVDTTDFHLFKKYTIMPSVQPVHAISDMPWAEERVGPERIRGAYAYKSLLEQNGLIAFGSDFPVEQINPLLGYYAAVSRKDFSGNPATGWYIKEKISPEDALKAMTLWGSMINFTENYTGSLEVGKEADFVILNNDLRESDPDVTFKTKVFATFISGKKVN